MISAPKYTTSLLLTPIHAAVVMVSAFREFSSSFAVENPCKVKPVVNEKYGFVRIVGLADGMVVGIGDGLVGFEDG